MRTLLAIVLLVGAAAATGYGTYAAFADSTGAGSNSFEGGTVRLTSNAAAAPVYALTSRAPGDTGERCVKVTYDGSLAADVRLYRGAFSGGDGLDAYVGLSVVRGSGDQPDCSDFTVTATAYSGTLGGFPATHEAGIVLAHGGGSTTWSQGDTATFRITAELQDDLGAQGLATGTHSFTWEARNE